jgi:hypothetical protein
MADDDLKNLPPEERIRKLKEIEEKKKKEIKDAQDEIKRSEDEIIEMEKWNEKVLLPDIVENDFLKKSPDEDLNLEELAKQKVDLPPELMGSEYTLQLSQKPMTDIYKEMQTIYQSVGDKGYISGEEERRVEYLASAVEKKVEDVETGNYSFSEDVANAASITRQIGSKLRNMYQSNVTYKTN